jgi:hypothetical protein
MDSITKINEKNTYEVTDESGLTTDYGYEDECIFSCLCSKYFGVHVLYSIDLVPSLIE